MPKNHDPIHAKDLLAALKFMRVTTVHLERDNAQGENPSRTFDPQSFAEWIEAINAQLMEDERE